MRPSPLQNRVLPTGEIVAVAGRGTMMGNRCCIHRPDRTLGVTRWRTRAWICCVLDWRGKQRDVMPPGRWTALFFLDEATALAAGHRPCAYCRRHAFLAWAIAATPGGEPRRRAPELDAALHAERLVARSRTQQTRAARVRDLPDLAIVRHAGAIALVHRGALRAWSWRGYGEPAAVPGGTEVELLTPPTSIGALRNGYLPQLHPSI